jgi:hypothetical protein
MGIRRARKERLTYLLDGQGVWFDIRRPSLKDVLGYDSGQGGPTERERLDAFLDSKVRLASDLLMDMEPGKLDYETDQDGKFAPLDATVPAWRVLLVEQFGPVVLAIANEILDRNWKPPQEVGQAEVNFTKPSVSSGGATSEVAPTAPNGTAITEPGPVPSAGK